MAIYSVTIQSSLVQAIFSQLPDNAKFPGVGKIPASFLISPTDPTSGTLSIDDSFTTLVNGIMSEPNLFSKYLISYVAAVRYGRQIGGVTFNGMAIQTDPSSQGLINGAVSLVTLSPSTVIDFKGGNGYVSLTGPQVLAIGTVVGTYIQQCFSAERAIGVKINNGTYSTTALIDSAQEWPSSIFSTTGPTGPTGAPTGPTGPSGPSGTSS